MVDGDIDIVGDDEELEGVLEEGIEGARYLAGRGVVPVGADIVKAKCADEVRLGGQVKAFAGWDNRAVHKGTAVERST